MQVEKHYVGRLQGFRFFPDTQAEGIHGKATRNAAAHVLAKELAMRVRRVVVGQERCLQAQPQRPGRCGASEEIARLEAGEDPLKPIVVVLADEHLRRARQGEGAGAAQRLDHRADRRAAEAAGRDRRAPRTSPAWRAASPSASRRTSACCGARAWPRRSARSISRRGRSCASTACASAPSTSTSRPC